MKSVVDGISEDGVAKLQEKAEPGLAVKQKGRKNKNLTALGSLTWVLWRWTWIHAAKWFKEGDLHLIELLPCVLITLCD